MSYAAIVVTYHPTAGDIANLEALALDARQLIVVDNSDWEVPLGNLPSSVVTIRPGSNVGIASALNVGIDAARRMGATHVVFLDQDSKLPRGYCERMVEFFERAAQTAPIAIAAPNYRERNSETDAHFALFHYLRWSRVACATHGVSGVLRVSLAITSGSVTSMAVVDRLGLFRSELFIDEVDAEYCLRARRAGMHVLVNCRERIEHSIGESSTHRILGVVVKPTHHSPFRRYFIARNGIRIALEYSISLPAYGRLIFSHLFLEVLTISLFEKEKRPKLWALMVGVVDGFRGRLGPRTPAR